MAQCSPKYAPAWVCMSRPFQCTLLNSQLPIAYALAKFYSNYVLPII